MKAILFPSPDRRELRAGMWLPACAVVWFLLAPGFLNAQSPAGSQQSVESQAFIIKADSQYELAVLYFKSGEIDKAVAAIKAILQPPIPPQYEEAVVKSLDNVTGKLRDLRRFDLAQSLLDEGLKVLNQKSSRADIYRKKAGFYYLSGDNEKAIQAWLRAEAEERK